MHFVFYGMHFQCRLSLLGPFLSLSCMYSLHRLCVLLMYKLVVISSWRTKIHTPNILFCLRGWVWQTTDTAARRAHACEVYSSRSSRVSTSSTACDDVCQTSRRTLQRGFSGIGAEQHLLLGDDCFETSRRVICRPRIVHWSTNAKQETNPTLHHHRSLDSTLTSLSTLS